MEKSSACGVLKYVTVLNHIAIKNFATIESLETDFYEGLNIITGETGAGKSIIFEAIGLTIGERGDKHMVRAGSEAAEVRADFGDKTLRREVLSSGKTKCEIDDKAVTVFALKTVGENLLDIHGQYDNQALLNEENHITIFDSFAALADNDNGTADGGDFAEAVDFAETLGEVKSHYENYKAAKSAYENLKYGNLNSERELSFIKFELDEIAAINPKPGEDEALENEIKLLTNAEKINKRLGAAASILDGCKGGDGDGGENGDAGLVDNLAKLLPEIEAVTEYFPELASEIENIEELKINLSELSSDIKSKLESGGYNPFDFDDKISRFDKIENLKRKHGGSVDEILRKKKDLEAKIEASKDLPLAIKKAEEEFATAETAIKKSSEKLSELRRKFARLFEETIERELADLAFTSASFKVYFDDDGGEYSEKGVDKISFLLSANKGIPLRPLAKIASGGEISRIALAIKTVSLPASKQSIIFDEIDTGMSGNAADIVGKKLKALSKKTQVIAVTHLPQIAAYADAHYKIIKETTHDKTSSDIAKLSENESTREIARLFSGSEISAEQLSAAKQLKDKVR